MASNPDLEGTDIAARAWSHCLWDLDDVLQEDYQQSLMEYDAHFVLPAADTRPKDTTPSRTDFIDPRNFNEDQRAVYNAVI
ncbi:hypothetical protein MBANPS3_002823 [Mucor bainieri]